MAPAVLVVVALGALLGSDAWSKQRLANRSSSAQPWDWPTCCIVDEPSMP